MYNDIDHQFFQFNQKGKDCVLNCKSTKDVLNHLDTGLNYCHFWDIASQLDGFTDFDRPKDKKAGKCRY